MSYPQSVPRRHSTQRWWAKLLVALGLMVAGVTAAVAVPSAAHADLPPTAYTVYRSCGSRYVSGVGVAPRYSTITVFPNWAALGGPGAAASTWSAAYNCSPELRSQSAAVLASLQAQLYCHVYYNAGLNFGGYAWDLETYRGTTWNQWTWVRNRCNW